MDENEGRNPNEQFNRNKFSKKIDDHTDHNKELKIRMYRELGLMSDEESKNESSSDDDVTSARGRRLFENNDSVERNTNVEFRVNEMNTMRSVRAVENREWLLDQRKRPRSPHHHGDPIENSRNIGSSSQGTISSHRNELGQGQGIGGSGTRPVLHSGSLSHGMMLNHQNVFGQDQGIGGSGTSTRPMLHSESLSHRTMFNHQNVFGQGQGFEGTGTRPVLHSDTSNSGRMVYNQNVLSQGLGINGRPDNSGFFFLRSVHEHNMRIRSDPNMDYYNQFLISSQPFSNRSVAPYVNSGFFIPNVVHEHNMRMRSDMSMLGGNVFRQGVPMVQLGSFRGPFGASTPTFASILHFHNIGLPVVAPSVNPPLVMPGSGTNEYNMGISSSTSAQSGGEHSVRIGEASYRQAATSHLEEGSNDRRDGDAGQEDEHGREHNNEHGSTSRDSKKVKR